jgi:23S rRNA (guanosine2251-2'-O)-methyltransferase
MSKRKGFDARNRHRSNRQESADRGHAAARPPASVSPLAPAAHWGSGYWLFGIHPVLAALANKDRKISRLIAISQIQSENPAIRELCAKRTPQPLVIETIDRSGLDRIFAAGTVHQGIAALVQPLEGPDILEVCDRAATVDSAIVLVLDQVTDPHNVGAILRSASAFGAQAVIVTERHAAAESGTLAKAAAGALEHVPLVAVTNLARAMRQLKEAGFWCAGLDAAADRTLAEAQLAGRIALVLGAEGSGLRRLTREHCDLLVRLPTSGPIGQLNVSCAAAAALYELARGPRPA